MGKLKALILIIIVATFGSHTVYTMMENKELNDIVKHLTNEVNVYKEAYIEATKPIEREELTRHDYAEMCYGIEAELLEAIERLETGNYTSAMYSDYNNTWGAFDGIEYKSFDSVEQSTMELARALKFFYFDRGLDTLEEINTEFCPSDSEWANKVKQIYEEIKNEG